MYQIFSQETILTKQCSIVFTAVQNRGNQTQWGGSLSSLSFQQDTQRSDQHHRVSWVIPDNRKLTLFEYYQLQHEHSARDSKQNSDPLIGARSLQDANVCTTTPWNVPRWVQKQWNKGKHTSKQALERQHTGNVLFVLGCGGFTSYSKEAANMEVVLLGGAGPEFVPAQLQHFGAH